MDEKLAFDALDVLARTRSTICRSAVEAQSKRSGRQKAKRSAKCRAIVTLVGDAHSQRTLVFNDFQLLIVPKHKWIKPNIKTR